KVDFPISIKEEKKIPIVEYKGYRFINRFPEFHYTVNGVDVYELITPYTNGDGLIRKFRVPKSDSKVWFNFDVNDGVNYHANAGKMSIGKLELSAEEAKEFTITMVKKEGSL